MEIKSDTVEVHIFKVINGELKFLILKRANNVVFPGLWQMVTGKIEGDEKAYETALRELKEETGLIPKNLWVAPNVNSFYSHENNSIIFLPVFVVEVEIDAEVIIGEEHTEYKWAAPEEAQKLFAWAGQRKSVEIITQYFLKEKNFLELVKINH
ncbi:MAG: NUDIX domain-containing protein [Ignavibacteriaceae bacterium]|nr:NUDIX domain-containing protein [Ignavibacteriaceae bacterium]